MKAYRILPRTDEEHESDMELLDFLEKKIKICETMNNYRAKQFYQRAFDLYAELEETYSRLDDVKTDRDYYREKCNAKGRR